VIAEEEVRSEAIVVRKGQVAGLKQTAHGTIQRKDVITLDFQAYIGAKDEYDAIIIDGVPPTIKRFHHAYTETMPQ
jgi:hypothetical protein